MNHAFPLRRDAFRRGGFTLIEVVIALAIFLFGALAIVRIFPPALGIIQNSGDQLTAINLNRSTLAQLEKSPNLVPDATYDLSPNFSGSTVGTALRNASLPRTNVQNFENTALAHFRNIAGEQHTVSLFGTSPYLITQFPYEMPTVAQPTLRAPLIYTEDTVIGARMKLDGTIDFSDARLQSDDSAFTDVSGALPPTTYRYSGTTPPTLGDTVFYVSYSWIAKNDIQSVVDEPIVYTTNATTGTLTVQGRRKAAMAMVSPVEGVVKLRLRRFKYMGPTPTVGDDFRGVINLSASPTPFSDGEIVSVDYGVKDWRWLVSNESPSIKPEEAQATDNFGAVITPVRFFDKDQDLFTLLVNQNKEQSKGIYSGGVPLATGTGTGFPIPTKVADPVDAKKGQVIFDLNTTTIPTTFARSRIVYRTLDNWTQQLSVAAQSYKPFYGATFVTTPAEHWRDYIYADDGSIYFSPTEAGKSISVSYVFTSGSPSVTYQIKNRILQIDQRTIDATSGINDGVGILDADSGRKVVSQLFLTDNFGNNLTDVQVKGIQAVLGASIQSRTAWIDGDKFTQVSSVGLRAVNN